jgi:hypothetical protein
MSSAAVCTAGLRLLRLLLVSIACELRWRGRRACRLCFRRRAALSGWSSLLSSRCRCLGRLRLRRGTGAKSSSLSSVSSETASSAADGASTVSSSGTALLRRRNFLPAAACPGIFRQRTVGCQATCLPQAQQRGSSHAALRMRCGCSAWGPYGFAAVNRLQCSMGQSPLYDYSAPQSLHPTLLITATGGVCAVILKVILKLPVTRIVCHPTFSAVYASYDDSTDLTTLSISPPHVSRMGHQEAMSASSMS